MLRKISEIYNKSKFSRNTAPKILSIIFAVVFWIFVMDQVNPEITREIDDVPVNIIGLEELRARNFEIMGEREFAVNVVLKGRRNEVININKTQISVDADIGSLTSGDQTVFLKASTEVEDIVIDKLSQSSIVLDVDAIVRQPVDVKIIKQGAVPTGYIAEDMTLSLQQIFVKGPESYVNAVESLRGLVNISNETQTVQSDVAVEPVDKKGETISGVEVETNYVTVTVPIMKVADILIEPQTSGNVVEGYGLTNVQVIPSMVSVKGERESINALKFINTEVIDINNKEESFELNVQLNVPDDIELNGSMDEVLVRLTVEKIVTTEFTYDYSDITFINKDQNLRTNIADLEGAVLLRVSAFESISNNLTKNDLTLYIDAENFEAGIMNSEIVLNKHNDFYDIEIIPGTIELEVTDLNDTSIEE